MGRWLPKIDTKYKGFWEWWWDDQSSCLYRHKKGEWHRFNTIAVRSSRNNVRDRFKFYTQVPEPMQMNTLKRTSVIYKQGYYITQGYRDVTTVVQLEEAREKTLDQLFIDLDKRIGE